jgi:WD40 repeat protein
MSTPMRSFAQLVAASALLLAAFVFATEDISKESTIWKGHEAGITAITLSPDGTRLASSGLDGTIRVWDTTSGRVFKVMRARDAELYAVAFARGGGLLVTTGNTGALTVFDARSGKTVREIKGLDGWSVDLAVSPDGRQVAAWGMDGRIFVWDLERKGPPRALVGESKKWGMALAWSPDGRVLAAGRASITLWDVERGSRLGELAGHKDFIRSLAFSPDGRLLASTGLDKTVRVWNIPEARERYVLKPEGLVHPSTVGPVTEPIRVPLLAVAFSPDGKTLATAGADRLVRLWEVETGRFIRSFEGHTMSVTALAFAPDGKTLFSAGLDKTVRVWRPGS